MSKFKMITSVLKAGNYIVITDDINYGSVKAEDAEDYLELLGQITEMLKESARDYTLSLAKQNND